MLMPLGNGKLLTTVAGRGPYRLANIQDFARESLQAAGGRLAIDENHSTDLAAPRGEPAPSRGLVTEIEVRDGGYGRVEWSAPSAAHLAQHVPDNEVHRKATAFVVLDCASPYPAGR